MALAGLAGGGGAKEPQRAKKCKNSTFCAFQHFELKKRRNAFSPEIHLFQLWGSKND